mmetsp:Transcript_28221/g.68689  ORF Transcript_28221/g.68689 Transcript_28221/m.68689 type:complete len:731 (+) Transcript_28221:125-2317(+)|eukprot:CAMPEP_0113621930 /NCGR_PEP_ID=MMETSP0017_2-20120614/11224_1 /TAXON_ID=2856 /ORGANISM="Cylindrotheca closterium" /LENGTH=730 /DNA_ID=CAMNT_0000531721 /DNA_START=98 /DNA_END=2290 /DNA_ORIENTATION=+ /assembly_acc=CAM_ASM_000147
MKFQALAVSLVSLSSAFDSCVAFSTQQNVRNLQSLTLRSTAEAPAEVSAEVSPIDSLTHDIISKLQFREAQDKLEMLQLDTSGTLSAMRERLRGATVHKGAESTPVEEEVPAIDEEKLNAAFENSGISFEDTSDPDFDFKELIREAEMHANDGHWKSAIRKMKKLSRRYGRNSPNPRELPESLYLSVLQECSNDRLHAARAAEPARKMMEEMVTMGYEIPADTANYCISNCLSDGVNGSHQGFGGIDTALAMMAALEQAENPVDLNLETYSRLIATLAAEGSIEYALKLLRELVAEKSETPSLDLFAAVASSCLGGKENPGNPDVVMTVLAYAKAAGYELDRIASTEDGRKLLASGVIAAEKLDNIGLGLRFLTAASKAEGCEPDHGDVLVSNDSPAAQRAATIIHRKALAKATKDDSWKLSVRLLELMISRGLRPSPATWRNVVTCCAKLEKSRKATSLLLDWVSLSKVLRAEKPPIRVFNTVVNACEVCGEEELTIQVLDAMKETHNTEGNLITFNIALKRLAKQGNTMACEGIVIGMLQNGIEPSVVSYTTTIAACVHEPKKPDVAMEWINRMKSRLVKPNVITYNTAFAACLDGTLQGSSSASRLAIDMIASIQEQLDAGILDADEYTNVIPNFYTKSLARQAMKQLKTNWEAGLIERSVAKETLRVPLLQLVEFANSDLNELAQKQKEFISMGTGEAEELVETTEATDEELEYATAIGTHRAAAV